MKILKPKRKNPLSFFWKYILFELITLCTIIGFLIFYFAYFKPIDFSVLEETDENLVLMLTAIIGFCAFLLAIIIEVIILIRKYTKLSRLSRKEAKKRKIDFAEQSKIRFENERKCKENREKCPFCKLTFSVNEKSVYTPWSGGRHVPTGIWVGNKPVTKYESSGQDLTGYNVTRHCFRCKYSLFNHKTAEKSEYEFVDVNDDDNFEKHWVTYESVFQEPGNFTNEDNKVSDAQIQAEFPGYTKKQA